MSRPLREVLLELRAQRWVDLTHAFSPEIPHSPLFAPERRTTVHEIDRDGFAAQRHDLIGQWGTHVDPPAHFVAGLRHQDEIDVREMLLELCVLDVSDAVALDSDHRVTPAELADFERRHGRVPSGAFVALHTGWGRRWPDRDAMRNVDAAGFARTPGWGAEVLETLFEQRGITAIGHDMTDTDRGLDAGTAPLERYVLSRDAWQIELLAALDDVPPAGALIVVSWPKPQAGLGFPARAFAICPEEN